MEEEKKLYLLLNYKGGRHWKQFFPKDETSENRKSHIYSDKTIADRVSAYGSGDKVIM